MKTAAVIVPGALLTPAPVRKPLRKSKRAMTAAQALAFVKRHGIVLESAGGPVPSLAAKVAGEPVRGGWWSHPKGNDIFLLSRAIRESPQVLVCRIVGGKVTYVHRHLWPALVFLAGRFSRKSLAAIKEVHTPAGKHKLLITPFPDWVPKEVLRAAHELKDLQAAAPFAAILDALLPPGNNLLALNLERAVEGAESAKVKKPKTARAKTDDEML